jgi:hypothetical protein
VKNVGFSRTSLCAFSIVLGVAACSTGAQSGADAGTTRDRNVITRAELEGWNSLNAYEAIRRLRPTWLRYRGQGVLTGPDRESMRIYVNGSFFGDADSLSNIQARNIREIRFLDARQATLRYGTDHTVGAIVVTTGGN